MPTTKEPLTFPVFQGPKYPFNQPDKDEITTHRLKHSIPLHLPTTHATPPLPSTSNPVPPTTKDTPLDLTPTAAPELPTRESSTISKITKCASEPVVKLLQRCTIFRAYFPLNELNDQNSEVAKMLYKRWEDAPEPPRHWTYEAAERKPGDYGPKMRRKFKGMKGEALGWPVWELEAEAVAKGWMTEGGEWVGGCVDEEEEEEEVLLGGGDDLRGRSGQLSP